MSPASTKPFGPIRAEYTFFETHATEAAADLRAYAPYIHALAAENRPVRLLDFGCGEGRFSAQFLALLGLAPEQLWLSLVEPDARYRYQAVEQLQPFTAHPVRAWPDLPPDLDADVDLLLANHVLYYVPDLDYGLSALRRALAAPGLLLIAMGGQRHPLFQLLSQGFALMGKPVPFHSAEDLEEALVHQGEGYSKQEVHSVLTFLDSTANRERILRFLLGSDVPVGLRQPMQALFTPYAAAGTVTIPLVHEQFILQREDPAGRGAGTPVFPGRVVPSWRPV